MPYKTPPEHTQFKKGDPRINRKGRPKSFKAFRDLVQSVGNEIAKDKNDQPIIIDGHVATVAEMIVRSWAKDNKHQRDFVEYAYGKVPNPIELSGNEGKPIEFGVKAIDYRAAITPLAPRSMDDSDTPSEGESPFDGETLG
jgi:hypothetical protein